MNAEEDLGKRTSQSGVKAQEISNGVGVGR